MNPTQLLIDHDACPLVDVPRKPGFALSFIHLLDETLAFDANGYLWEIKGLVDLGSLFSKRADFPLWDPEPAYT